MGCCTYLLVSTGSLCSVLTGPITYHLSQLELRTRTRENRIRAAVMNTVYRCYAEPTEGSRAQVSKPQSLQAVRAIIIKHTLLTTLPPLVISSPNGWRKVVGDANHVIVYTNNHVHQ